MFCRCSRSRPRAALTSWVHAVCDSFVISWHTMPVPWLAVLLLFFFRGAARWCCPLLLPLSLPDVCRLIGEATAGPGAPQFFVLVSYLEIYNEVLKDLLNPTDKQLKIREHPEMGIYVVRRRSVCVCVCLCGRGARSEKVVSLSLAGGCAHACWHSLAGGCAHACWHAIE